MHHVAEDAGSTSLNDALLDERNYYNSRASTAARQESGHKHEIARLRDDVRRLRRQRDDEQDEVDHLNKVIQRQEDEIKYLERKCEQLRRELITHGRARSPQGPDQRRFEDIDDAKLLNLVTEYEVERDIGTLNTNATPASGTDDHAEGTTSLAQRISDQDNATNTSAIQGNGHHASTHLPQGGHDATVTDANANAPLETRITNTDTAMTIEDTGNAQPATLLNPALMNPSPATFSVADMWAQLVPERDMIGDVVVLDGTQTGYRMIYGLPVNAAGQLPDEPPTTGKINLTVDPTGTIEVPEGHSGIPITLAR